MATRKSTKPAPFAGKETKREERLEKRAGKRAYAAGERAEGMHGKTAAYKKGGRVC